ncbi:YezD family protein [Neobacillus sp. LXY-4]|uniref:YezD family protein n=1 Tax=Neobacillus sp. LXY-4 TaxID=3379826 RepID=UPI003EE091CF
MAVIDQEKQKFILESLKGLQYGSVVITIHDGQITQVDRTEKNRFPSKNLVRSRKPLGDNY